MKQIECIAWRAHVWAGHESAALFSDEGSWILKGTAVLAHEGQPCRLDYVIRCNERWETREVRVEGWIGKRVVDIALEAADLGGCMDIDLNFSPSTNLLPIRRLNLRIGESADVRAAWLRFPSLELQPFDQRYTRLAEDRYRYQSASFSAELRVSPAGFPLDYEKVWTAEASL